MLKRDLLTTEKERNTIQNTLFKKKYLEVAVTSSSIKSPLYLKFISAINFFKRLSALGLIYIFLASRCS